MAIRTIVRACVLLAVVPALLLAGNRSGSVSGQFLKIPTSARAVGMGGALVSLAEGAGSIAFNPAGMLSIPNASFSGMYNQWWADIGHMFFGVGVNLDYLGHIGVGVTVLTTDDMIETTPQFPEGTGRSFKSAEFAYTLSYARQISREFGLGLSVKYIHSNLFNTDLNASSIAVDIGTLYDIDALRTRLGISITNLGSDLKYLNEQYSLPTTLRFGARVNVYEEEEHRAYAVMQIGRPNDAEEQYNLGVEYTFQQSFSLRAGYRFNYDTENFSGGLGVDLLQLLGTPGALDYSYTNYEFLPGTHMFTIELGF